MIIKRDISFIQKDSHDHNYSFVTSITVKLDNVNLNKIGRTKQLKIVKHFYDK